MSIFTLYLYRFTWAYACTTSGALQPCATKSLACFCISTKANAPLKPIWPAALSAYSTPGRCQRARSWQIQPAPSFSITANGSNAGSATASQVTIGCRLRAEPIDRIGLVGPSAANGCSEPSSPIFCAAHEYRVCKDGKNLPNHAEFCQGFVAQVFSVILAIARSVHKSTVFAV